MIIIFHFLSLNSRFLLDFTNKVYPEQYFFLLVIFSMLVVQRILKIEGKVSLDSLKKKV